MTKEAFEQEIGRLLDIHRRRYPAMEREDGIKFVFQAMLGVGHLLGDPDTVAARVAAEMADLRPDPDEPMLEALSPAWCRLHLRRAAAEGLDPRTVAGLMRASEADPGFTRQDVLDACRRWFPPDGDAETDGLRNTLDESWLPSHSSRYKALYRPAYRVVSADWIPYMDAVLAIAKRQKESRRVLVTIDGPCGSGKTTLAGRLAEVFEGSVVHTDHFVVPHAQKTAERLAVPGGNCDAERLAGEVAVPWKEGRTVRFRRYDWSLDALLPEETLPDGGVLIIEGSYCNLPAVRPWADVRLYMTTPENVRTARLMARESPESMKRFREKWIPLENAYFEAYHLPDKGCIQLFPDQTDPS